MKVKQKTMFSFFSRSSNPAVSKVKKPPPQDEETKKNDEESAPSSIARDKKELDSKLASPSSDKENESSQDNIPSKSEEEQSERKDSHFGQDCVDRRLRVYWPNDDAWYPGRVKSFDARTKKHVILYEDGEEESVMLSQEKFEWVEARSRRAATQKVNYRMIVDSDSEQEFEEGGGKEAKPNRSAKDEDEDFKMDTSHNDEEEENDDDNFIVDGDESEGENSSAPKSRKRLNRSKPTTASSAKKVKNAAAQDETPRKGGDLAGKFDMFKSPAAKTPAENASGAQVTAPAGLAPSPTAGLAAAAAAGGKDEEEGGGGGGGAARAQFLAEGVFNVGRHQHDDWPWLAGERRDAGQRRPEEPGYDPRTLWVPPAFLAKETAAMQQWWGLKARHMDTVLFFKVGKFYELFHMDADVGMRELDLIYMKGPKAHSGFPETAYGKMSAALVAKGYKVARVEQTETPEALKARNAGLGKGQKKAKVVARELCSVLTRGTRTCCYLDPDEAPGLEDPGAAWLLAVRERPLAPPPPRAAPPREEEEEREEGGGGGAAAAEEVPAVVEVGVAAVNAPTGRVLLGQFADGPLRPRLRTLLTQLPPVECLVPQGEGGLSDLTLSMLRNSGNAPALEPLREGPEFPTAGGAVRRLKRGRYFPGESKVAEEEAAGGEGPEGTGRWPELLRAVVAGGESSALALSCLGAVTHWLQRSLIDHDLLSLQRFEPYIPPDLEEEAAAGGAGEEGGGGGGGGGRVEGDAPPGSKMVLDGNALANLEILVNNTDGKEAGSLWAHMNRCGTAFGRRRLREWLTRPLRNIAEIEARLDAVQALAGPLSAEAEGLRKQVLGQTPDLERLLARIHSMASRHRAREHPEARAVMYEGPKYARRKIRDFAQALGALRQLDRLPGLFEGLPPPAEAELGRSAVLRRVLRRRPLASQGAAAGGTGAPFDPREGQFPHLKQALDHFDEVFDAKQAEKDGCITARPGVDPEYDEARAAIDAAEAALQEHLAEQQRALRASPPLAYFGKGKDRYQLEVPEAALPKGGAPAGYELTSKRKGFKRFRTPEIHRRLRELEHAEGQLEEAKQDHQRKIFARFDEQRELWASAAACAAEADALCALAAVASYPGYTRPRLVPAPPGGAGPFLSVRGGRHPCIAHTFAGDFIPNDTLLGTPPPGLGLEGEAAAAAAAAGEEGAGGEVPRLMLLSGPNMGGKSTLLRQTCLLAVLAQCGSFVPAEALALSPVDRVFTRLGATDRILSGESTFFVELGEAAAVLAGATRDSLVILDELGRGTSTFDGTAIAHAVVEHLVRRAGCRALFATHYHSLVADWGRRPGVALGHMSCHVDADGGGGGDQQVTFLYKLAPGSSPKSYGLNVARLARLPAPVLRLAAAKSAEFEALMARHAQGGAEAAAGGAQGPGGGGGGGAEALLLAAELRAALAEAGEGAAGAAGERELEDRLLQLWHRAQRVVGSA